MSVVAIREQHEPAVAQAAMGLVEWAQEADAAYRLAQKLVGTSFVPVAFKGKPDEAAAAMLAGAEVGLSPMASLSAFDVIQGRAAPRAITLRAIAQSHGCEIVVTEATPTRVTIEGRRRGDERWTPVTWTLDRARDLGLLTKDQWKKQPQTMLIARATSELARLIAADAILGIGYSIEELQDDIPEPTAKVSRSTSRVQRQPKPQPPEPEFDEPEPAQEPVKAPPAERADEEITAAQLKALNAAMTQDLELTDRADKLAYLSGALGREIGSSKDVTKAEASRLLDDIARDMQGAEPVEPTLDES